MRSKPPTTNSRAESAARRQRFAEGLHLQAMEGNPLDTEDLAMFEMFEREGRLHHREGYRSAGPQRR
jgi:hypothetical protein